jgi:site-specific DNA recombinase
VSGATITRPALSQLMADAAARMFNRVIVTDPDRLSRDLVDGLVIERDLTTTGVEVTYLVQPAVRILERQIRGVIAEEERRKTRERPSRGLRAVATARYWTGGPPPYGYQLQATPSRRNQLAINPAEAAVIVEMIDAIIDH